MSHRSRTLFSALVLCTAASCGEDGESPALPGVDAGNIATGEGGSPGTVDAALDSAMTGGPIDAASSAFDAASSDGGASTDGATQDAAIDPTSLDKFSFFVTSFAGIKKLAGNDKGFGGDLRFGETGENAGLKGADKICAALAETSQPGSAAKQWRAFLSTSTVNAKDRIGAGPWYDRRARLVAMNVADLLNTRPAGAHAEIINDLPNESGTPNHNPDGTGQVDNHDVITGTNAMGAVFSSDRGSHCDDWTNATVGYGKPRVGHSWPRAGGGGGGFGGGGLGGMENWMSALNEAGCGAGAYLDPTCDGPPDGLCTPADAHGTVGSGGGYGGFYCFALTP